MHIFKKFYYFIDNFDKKEIQNLNQNIALIYRNYNNNIKKSALEEMIDFCKKNKRDLFISNNLKIAIRYNLAGVYLPSFNKKLKYKNLNTKKNFKIIGSAHNQSQIKIKELQGCKEIFISPIFKTDKNKFFLGVIKFNFLVNKTKKKIICLGGINSNNLRKIQLTKSAGIASISWIKKTAQVKT